MSKVILVVEDDDRSIELLTDFLEANEYNVIQARNGQDGIDMAFEHIPNLVITDLQMPIKSGVELIKELKNDARTSKVPIIVATSSAMVGDKEKILLFGCDEYVSKPIDLKDMIEIVRRHIHKAEGHHE